MMMVGEGLAVILTLALGFEQPFRFFGAVSLAVQWVVLATIAEVYLLRGAVGEPFRPILVANLALALLLANVCVIAFVTRYTFEPVSSLTHEQWTRMQLRMVGIVVVLGLLGLAAFRNHWHASRLAVRVTEAELELLQARIQPHFLFNTLNSGIALVRQRPEQAEDLLLGLSDLFRAALARPHDVPLAEELALVRRYLEIEAVRFGPRLRVAWQLPDALPEVAVPALSVQALVENAVRHGIERLPGGGEVGIEVASDDAWVEVVIRNAVPTGSDTGKGGHSIGLQATKARLHASTGGRGSLEPGREGGEFVVRMRVPTG
jgi:two-component system sensor histidine kinase AlgZ